MSGCCDQAGRGRWGSNCREVKNLTIDELIADSRLLSILAVIEEYLGYKIETAPMPQDHKALAACSLHLENNKFILLYIEDELPLQETICHELMHIVLSIEGYPAFRFINLFFWYPTEYRTQIVTMLSNLVLHIEVWKLTDTLGFNEQNYYSLTELIRRIESSILFQDAHLAEPWSIWNHPMHPTTC
jgi:hypothetical protein